MRDEEFHALIERAEDLLGYFEQHGEAMTYGPDTTHREWWMGEAATFLRDVLPDWSAFKIPEVIDTTA